MTTSATDRSELLIADAIGRFVTGAPGRNYPEQVLELAQMCLVDWFAVCIGARNEPAQAAVRRVVEGWGTAGKAPVLLGSPAAAPAAALVNGTMAHCLDFDDLHFPSLSHLSAPIWAAVLAAGAQRGSDERTMLGAFVIGFEIGARLGSNGVGQAVSHRGWHSTGVVGRLGAAAAASVVLGLDAEQARHAAAVAATQTSGLTASFGTMSKPFHAGKAAMDGVLAAQLAAEGFQGATDILDAERGLAAALIQDGEVSMRLEGLGESWEIERNAIKPYACCGLTHATIDCGRELSGQIAPPSIASATLEVNPLTLKVADKRAVRTPLEGKFSVTYCAALALSGHAATETDFAQSWIDSPQLQAVAAQATPVACDDLVPNAARMQVKLVDGRELRAETAVSLGNPENPMTWDDMERKFMPLVQPALGDDSGRLYQWLRDFDRPGRFAEVMALAA